MDKTSQLSFFGFGSDGEIVEMSADDATRFLLPRHYSGRTPSISKAFGWYFDGELKAVVTFGKPASPNLCEGVCGVKYADRVYELNRLCREDGFREPLSHFVATCLKRLKPYRWIVVSYSDTAMNHHGYIYQACNFLYTGVTKERTDIHSGGEKHSRHYTKDDVNSGFRQVRSAKHRYVYFCTSSRREREEWQNALRYNVLPYPKGDNNPDYKLGKYLKKTIVKSREEQT